eukprot:scaffold3901_cov174-Amphora_coffeaeformis.AAC.6
MDILHKRKLRGKPTMSTAEKIDEDNNNNNKHQEEQEEESSPLCRQVTKLRQRRVWFLLLALPFVVGLVWHGLHPFMSVFTGDFDKPRRLYVDENSAEPNYFRINHSKFKRRDQLLSKQQQMQQQQMQRPASSLCRAVKAVVINAAEQSSFSVDRGNILCRGILHHQAVVVDVLQITPMAGPVAVRSEAIVLVLPAAADWMTSPLHAAFLSFLVELLNPKFTWLAKTVFVVAPRVRDDGQKTLSISRAVRVFLEAYLGPTADTTTTTDHPSVGNLVGPTTMPPGMISSALLRQMIVWDQELMDEQTTTMKLPTIRVLPQGPRGLLPNMDLVSVVRAALQRTVGSNAQLEIHPFQEESHRLCAFLDFVCQMFTNKKCPEKKVLALSNLFWFEHALRGHDFTAPHAVALERGLDALTIQLVVRQGAVMNNDVKTRNVASKIPAAMEICIRALSNLHERLHHSTSLYLLLDMDHFVKHEEYLVPNLLLLIPLILRAVTLFWVDLEHFDWITVGLVVERTLLLTMGISLGLEMMEFIDTHSWWILNDGLAARHTIVGLAYLYLAWRFVFVKERWSVQSRRSVQCFACFWALYTHVAIAFGHVSLAFPSALLWTPLLAFPFYHDDAEPKTNLERIRGTLSRILGPLTFLALTPFVWFVPNVMPSYTPYVCFAYIPLHLMLSQLLLS